MRSSQAERRDSGRQGLVAFPLPGAPDRPFHARDSRSIARSTCARRGALERGLLIITIPRLKDRRGTRDADPVQRVE
jgi:hypothetical protein